MTELSVSLTITTVETGLNIISVFSIRVLVNYNYTLHIAIHECVQLYHLIMLITIYKIILLYSKLSLYMKFKWTLFRNNKEREGHQMVKHRDIRDPNLRKQLALIINNLLFNNEPRTTLIPIQRIQLREIEWFPYNAYSYPIQLLCKCPKMKLNCFANTF